MASTLRLNQLINQSSLIYSNVSAVKTLCSSSLAEKWKDENEVVKKKTTLVGNLNGKNEKRRVTGDISNKSVTRDMTQHGLAVFENVC